MYNTIYIIHIYVYIYLYTNARNVYICIQNVSVQQNIYLSLKKKYFNFIYIFMYTVSFFSCPNRYSYHQYYQYNYPNIKANISEVNISRPKFLKFFKKNYQAVKLTFWNLVVVIFKPFSSMSPNHHSGCPSLPL